MGRFRKDKKQSIKSSTVPSAATATKGSTSVDTPIYNAIATDAALKSVDDATLIRNFSNKGMPIRPNIHQSKKQKLQRKRKQLIDRVIQRQKFDKKSKTKTKTTKKNRQKLQKLKTIDMSTLKTVLSQISTSDLTMKKNKSKVSVTPKATPKIESMPIDSEAGSLIRIKRQQLNDNKVITSQHISRQDSKIKTKKDGKMFSKKKKQRHDAKYRITHLSKLIADEVFRKNPRQVIKQHIQNKVCQAKFSTN